MYFQRTQLNAFDQLCHSNFCPPFLAQWGHANNKEEGHSRTFYGAPSFLVDSTKRHQMSELLKLTNIEAISTAQATVETANLEAALEDLRANTIDWDRAGNFGDLVYNSNKFA